MKNIAYFFCFILFCQGGMAQNNIDEKPHLVIIQPTGEMIGDLPEMIMLADSSELVKSVRKNIKNSFIKEAIDLYFITQVYLKNTQQIDKIEPAYLALTENQGGFAKFGFALKNGSGHQLKEKVGYVDITVDRASGSIDRLMSFSQLYPHELGHVYYHLLSSEDEEENNTKNVDMHFFSVITDYSTAFNEGFAEHIENVSRMHEKNEIIKSGIAADIKKIEQTSIRSIAGFKRDFEYPFRLGYYKVSMLNWYQKYEDLKRYKHVINGTVKYKNASLSLSDSEDQLTYRNSGVELDSTQQRNLVQLLATEGVISSFFTKLSMSDLGESYLEDSFYHDFILESDSTEKPSNLFSPLQNQFIKYFYVIDQFVVFNNSSRSQLTDFIEGYCSTFPEESAEVKKIFKNSTGISYTNKIPPPLWILVENYSHRLLVFDPFNAITVPIYTFDLNAAEVEDLITLDGLTKNDAQLIIKYRNEHGLFSGFNQLKEIPNLSEQAKEKIISSELDGVHLEKLLADYEVELSISALIIAPLIYLFSRASIYFVVVYGLLFFFFRRKEKAGLKKNTWLFVRYYFLMILLVLSGLTTVFIFESNYIYFIGVLTFLALLSLRYKKNKKKRIRTLVFLSAMSLMVLISMV
jgi:hypothetical protein